MQDVITTSVDDYRAYPPQPLASLVGAASAGQGSSAHSIFEPATVITLLVPTVTYHQTCAIFTPITWD
eukprot:3286615-Karenia_brevis.AAC.1